MKISKSKKIFQTHDTFIIMDPFLNLIIIYLRKDIHFLCGRYFQFKKTMSSGVMSLKAGTNPKHSGWELESRSKSYFFLWSDISNYFLFLYINVFKWMIIFFFHYNCNQKDKNIFFVIIYFIFFFIMYIFCSSINFLNSYWI